MFSFLNRNKKNEELFLIDIGTKSVKTSIVRLPSELEANPKVLSYTQASIPENTLNGRYVHDLDRLLDTVNQTLEHTIVAAGIEPGTAVIGVSAGSVKYGGLTVRMHREDSENEVQDKELDKILARLENETVSSAREKIDVGSDWLPLGVAITDYKVGGSFVQSPVGLTGKMVECTVLHGFWEDTVKKNIDILSSQLGLSVDMVWETSVIRALRAREMYESCVVVDIGGYATESVLLKNRRVVKNSIINVGADTWTARIADELQIAQPQAEKVKLAFHEGVLDQERAGKVKEILEQEIANFVHLIASLVHEMAAGDALPPAIVFTGEGSKLDLVKSKVISYPWTQGELFEAFPQIERLHEEFMNESLYYGYNLLS